VGFILFGCLLPLARGSGATATAAAASAAATTTAAAGRIWDGSYPVCYDVDAKWRWVHAPLRPRENVIQRVLALIFKQISVLGLTAFEIFKPFHGLETAPIPAFNNLFERTLHTPPPRSIENSIRVDRALVQSACRINSPTLLCDSLAGEAHWFSIFGHPCLYRSGPLSPQHFVMRFEKLGSTRINVPENGADTMLQPTTYAKPKKKGGKNTAIRSTHISPNQDPLKGTFRRRLDCAGVILRHLQSMNVNGKVDIHGHILRIRLVPQGAPQR
jgi:hypothetical protein